MGDFAAGLAPDFRASGRIVRVTIRGVVELVADGTFEILIWP